MRLAHQNALTVAIALLGMTAAFGQTTSTPLSGYECRMLNITEQQSMDPTFHVVVRSGPSETSPAAGWASAVIIVKTPAVPENGFLQMLLPNNRTVWISADDTKPYRSRSNPDAKCQPEILPSGRVGFGPG
jgi:hypothetical protein